MSLSLVECFLLANLWEESSFSERVADESLVVFIVSAQSMLFVVVAILIPHAWAKR